MDGILRRGDYFKGYEEWIEGSIPDRIAEVGVRRFRESTSTWVERLAPRHKQLSTSHPASKEFA
jgi:hypothetical protein